MCYYFTKTITHSILLNKFAQICPIELERQTLLNPLQRCLRVDFKPRDSLYIFFTVFRPEGCQQGGYVYPRPAGAGQT